MSQPTQYQQFLSFLRIDGEVIKTPSGYRSHAFGYSVLYPTRAALYARFKREFPIG